MQENDNKPSQQPFMPNTIEDLKKAADQGNALAQKLLGDCYELGEGVPEDLEEAARLRQLAGVQGNTAAQYILGYCYEYGEGVEKDLEKAARLYRLAAEQGDAAAQYSLGYCYEYGEGVVKDLKEATQFYRLAADQGFVDAQTCLKRIEESTKEIKQQSKVKSNVEQPPPTIASIPPNSDPQLLRLNTSNPVENEEKKSSDLSSLSPTNTQNPNATEQVDSPLQNLGIYETKEHKTLISLRSLSRHPYRDNEGFKKYPGLNQLGIFMGRFLGVSEVLGITTLVIAAPVLLDESLNAIHIFGPIGQALIQDVGNHLNVGTTIGLTTTAVNLVFWAVILMMTCCPRKTEGQTQELSESKTSSQATGILATAT